MRWQTSPQHTHTHTHTHSHTQFLRNCHLHACTQAHTLRHTNTQTRIPKRIWKLPRRLHASFRQKKDSSFLSVTRSHTPSETHSFFQTRGAQRTSYSHSQASSLNVTVCNVTVLQAHSWSHMQQKHTAKTCMKILNMIKTGICKSGAQGSR